MRVPGTYKDRGHYGRKAVAWTIAIVLFPVYYPCHLAGKFAERLIDEVAGLHRWSHPCLYAPRPRQPAPELSDRWKDV